MSLERSSKTGGQMRVELHFAGDGEGFMQRIKTKTREFLKMHLGSIAVGRIDRKEGDEVGRPQV